MPRLSIIIPVLTSASRLETTLVSVLEKRPADCEILVVLNEPYADPYDLRGEVCFLRLVEGRGLVASINHGIEASRASVVHLLSAGLEVGDGWADAALVHFQDPRVASVTPLVADLLDSNRALAAGLEYTCRRGRVMRSAIDGEPAGDARAAEIATAVHGNRREVLGPLAQAAFYRRAALELVGGFPAAVGDHLADVDLALTLKFAGYQSVLEPESRVLASAGDLMPAIAGFRRGLAAEQLFWRAAPIAGWLKSLAGHPIEVLADFATELPHPRAFAAMVGRLLGACRIRSHRAHHQWLLDVKRAAAALLRPVRPQLLRVDPAHARLRAAEQPVGGCVVSRAA